MLSMFWYRSVQLCVCLTLYELVNGFSFSCTMTEVSVALSKIQICSTNIFRIFHSTMHFIWILWELNAIPIFSFYTIPIRIFVSILRTSLRDLIRSYNKCKWKINETSKWLLYRIEWHLLLFRIVQSNLMFLIFFFFFFHHQMEMV